MRQTLLIADGDARFCDLYRQLLTESGYEVETASDGLDCLEKLRREMPGILVLDQELRWGGADGVIAWLREEGPPTGLSVVLTAPVGHPLDVVEDIDPAIGKTLSKPFGLRALLDCVRAAVAKKEREVRCNLNCSDTCSEFFIG